MRPPKPAEALMRAAIEACPKAYLAAPLQIPGFKTTPMCTTLYLESGAGITASWLLRLPPP